MGLLMGIINRSRSDPYSGQGKKIVLVSDLDPGKEIGVVGPN